jgi:hypothetical protein
MWWARNVLERNLNEDDFLKEVEAKIQMGLGYLKPIFEDQTLVTVETLTELIYELHLRIRRLEESRKNALGQSLPLKPLPKPLPPAKRLQETDRATPPDEQMPKLSLRIRDMGPPRRKS